MRWPAEWERHDAVWIGFPGDPAEWPIGLDAAQREVAAFADAIHDGGKGETVLLVCRDAHDGDIARGIVGDGVEIIIEPFGDIWLRDTGPIVTVDRGERVANDFLFNGWGRKYDMAGDDDIAQRLATRRNMPVTAHDWILEGGAIDGDGTGRCITTAQCLLHSNRNQGVTQYVTEERLRDSLGVSEICWVVEGLIADHTDGHVDNLVRFVAEGTVAIPEADSDDDPNRAIFEDAVERCEMAGLKVIRLPSVGRYEIAGEDGGEIAPASYMNFYIGNRTVVVPQYGATEDAKAVAQIAALFPGRKTIGLPSKAVLRGGGSFHCISQQIPEI